MKKNLFIYSILFAFITEATAQQNEGNGNGGDNTSVIQLNNSLVPKSPRCNCI